MTGADLLVTDAAIYTGDDQNPSAEAMAIADGRILAIGSEAEARTHAGPSTRTAALNGQFVMPGIVDVHNHHSNAGSADLFEVRFSPNADVDTILDTVATFCRGLAEDAWVLGGNWGAGLMNELATDSARHALDNAAGGRAVLLTDDSGHNRWASSLALNTAQITSDSTDPPGGQILRDPQSGEPSGIMLEAAARRMALSIPDHARPTIEQQRACSRRGIELLHGYGITTFQDAAVSTDILSALATLDEDDGLAAWVVSSLLVNDPIFGVSPVGEELLDAGPAYRTYHHRPDFVKIFLDGVPPARTGAFLEPYLPEHPGDDASRGPATMSGDELVWWLRRAARSGLSAKVHCTGDRSVRMVLDAVEQLRADGFTDTRYQIAHGQFVHPDDLPRFAELGVTADISPFLWVPGVIPHAISEVLPSDRAGRMQPNRDLLDSGALVAGGSDWPVSESPNAFQGMAGLITRQDPTRTFAGSLWPEQAVTRAEAIRIFTRNGATAMGLGDVTGSLTPGKSADFIVLDQDITAIEPEAIAATTVEATWFAGRRVHCR